MRTQPELWSDFDTEGFPGWAVKELNGRPAAAASAPMGQSTEGPVPPNLLTRAKVERGRTGK
eukprot:4736586-Prorocentrum_lima.AAC.1